MCQIGIFEVGRMSLGLPAENLREVVACPELCSMPCESSVVAGGINVRGSIIPVLDLDLILARPAAEHGHCLALIMSHQGRVLGLLVDHVAEIASIAREYSAARPDSGGGMMLESITLETRSAPVHLLAVAHFFALPGVPEVPDVRHAAIEVATGGAPSVQPPDGDGQSRMVRHMMVVRCGGLVMVLDSAFVHSTVPCPELLSSPLSGDYCEGAIAFDGRKIAAVDMLRLLGFPRGAYAGVQAFVVELESGKIACLVEEIIDVVKLPLPAALPVPRFALPRPEFVRGMHAQSVVQGQDSLRTKCQGAYLFELDGEAIVAAAELAGLARMNVGYGGDGEDAGRSAQQARRQMRTCQVLCYDIGYEVASQMLQVAEILPWKPEMQIFGAGQRPDGIVMSRGQVIPTYELCPLVGEPSVELGCGASILVVEAEGQSMGFVVPRLLSIDQAMLAPGARRADADGGLPEELGSSSDPVRIGEPDKFRFVSVVDLKSLAKKLTRAKFNVPETVAGVFAR